MPSGIAREVLAIDRAPGRVGIEEIMCKPVLRVHPDTDIRYVVRSLGGFDRSQAPVVEYGEAIGIVGVTALVVKGLVPRL